MDNIAVMTNRIKDVKQRLEFIVDGTEFEAQIVGAASYDTILNIEPPSTPQPGEQGMIRVKINYTHPFTRQQMTAHKTLRKADYKDDRLIRIANPEQTADSKLIAHMNHNHVKQNKKLYEHYKHEINARKISADEKAELLNEAFLRMTAEESSGTDSEGYTQLTPPVIAEGYLLNCEVIFIQKTNHTCFQEWIEDQQ